MTSLDNVIYIKDNLDEKKIYGPVYTRAKFGQSQDRGPKFSKEWGELMTPTQSQRKTV